MLKHKCVQVYYSGRVQGVGFRFTVERLAVEAGLTGWVKNLPDGRVEFVGEGKEGKLLTVLEKIDSELSGYIRQKNISWMPATGEFSSFEIRFF